MYSKVLNPAKYGRGLQGALKQGWNEIPEIIGSSAVMLVGLCFGAASIYIYNSRGLDNRKHKLLPIVMRSDDPRVAKIHKD
jgi:hypothetical protein